MKEINIKADLREFIINGKKILLGVASGKDLLKVELPNEPNSRDYMGKRNKRVEEMIETLKKESDLFLYKNNGIHILASDYIRKDDGSITLLLEGYEGIYNGNHTMKVLSANGREKSHVIMAVYTGVPNDKEIIAGITNAKNANAPTKEISKGEKLEKYEWVKAVFPDYKIKYKESDEEELDIATILHIAGLYEVDPKTCKLINENPNKFQTYTKKKSDIVRKNNSGKSSLDNTRYILKDLIDYFCTIRSDNKCLALLGGLKSSGWVRKDFIVYQLMLNLINALNFAFYVSKTTLYPCYKKDYNIDLLIRVTREVFPDIVEQIKSYEETGLKVEHICRGDRLYKDIKIIMLSKINEYQQRV